MRSDHAHFLSLNAAIAKMQSEDYQTPERARQTYNAGQEGSKQDSKEKASKKIYGKDGKVVYASLANMRQSLNKKNKAVAESVESAEYTELLESVLLALCEELALDPNALLEDFQTPAREKAMSAKLSKTDTDWQKKVNASYAKHSRLHDRLEKGYHKIKNEIEKEKSSSKVYGKGGKIVKKTKP